MLRDEFRHKEETDVTYSGSEDDNKPAKRSEPKVGRNAPCPCGSGKKYKKCCGA